MKLLFLVVLAFCCYSATYGKRIKKTQKDLGTIQKDEKHQTVKTKKGQHLQKAIIAIEIIDSNDNSTKTGSGRKRTIDSSLGYGYQSFFGVQQRPPKYEVYKYSQQDIFAEHKGPQQEQVYHQQQPQQQQQQQQAFDIQKSVQYDLGTTVQHYNAPKQQQQQQSLNQYYQHGTTLFSSLDQNGHVSQLSSEAPQHQGNSMVPVIVLRVYTNQLNQGGELHPNIPQNHPYSSLRSVDLQNLLSGYIQQQQQHQQQPQQQHYQEEPQVQQYQQQQQQYQQYQQQYQQPQQYQQQEYQPQYYQQPQQVYYQQPNDGLLTHENYPSNDHTKVIFTKHPNKEAPQIPQLPKKFKITIPENTFSKVEVQEHTYEQNQDQQQQLYYYPQPAQPFYEHPQQYQYQYYQNYPDPSQYYQQQQQYQYEETQNPPQYTYEQAHQPAPVEEETQHSESSDENLHKSSKDLGRDLHSKLYNYHAHGPSNTEKKASNKRMTRKRPAVTVEREQKE